MKPEFRLTTFDVLSPTWKVIQEQSLNSHIFSSPEWSRTWWEHFGSRDRLYLGFLERGTRIIGVAPLHIEDGVASFIGSSDVCDYLDFVVEPAKGTDFFTALLDHLVEQGINRLRLAPLRPDSSVLTSLVGIAQRQGWDISCSEEDASLELDLPATWEEYQQLLTSKQRHELRRKLKRLEEEGDVQYRTSGAPGPANIETFLRLFRDSREDKAAFLTPQIESFFRALVDVMIQQRLLRLGILELDGHPVAATMCFEYRNDVYLYNSGYDPKYSRLSVGLVSKALCIKDSIERGKRKFDFLKGKETYKYHLGGHEVPIQQCSFTFTGKHSPPD